MDCRLRRLPPHSQPCLIPPATTSFSAALWMGGALVSFMAMAVAGRELAGQLGLFQILFFRSLGRRAGHRRRGVAGRVACRAAA